MLTRKKGEQKKLLSNIAQQLSISLQHQALIDQMYESAVNRGEILTSILYKLLYNQCVSDLILSVAEERPGRS